MNRADAEIQERVDRLFDRFERMTDAEFLMLRTIWDEQDPTARIGAWTSIKAAFRHQPNLKSLMHNAENRIVSWVNNYFAPLALGDVPANFNSSGMAPGSVRRAAIPPMLDAIAATIAAEGLSASEQSLLMEPVTVLAR